MSGARSTICFACGYDMHDRAAGDLCPECATPFDDRPDWIGARKDALLILWCGIASLVMTLSVVCFPLGMLVGCLTLAMASWPGPNPKTHRALPRWVRHRSIGRGLAWASALVGLCFLAAGALWR